MHNRRAIVNRGWVEWIELFGRLTDTNTLLTETKEPRTKNWRVPPIQMDRTCHSRIRFIRMNAFLIVTSLSCFVRRPERWLQDSNGIRIRCNLCAPSRPGAPLPVSSGAWDGSIFLELTRCLCWSARDFPRLPLLRVLCSYWLKQVAWLARCSRSC